MAPSCAALAAGQGCMSLVGPAGPGPLPRSGQPTLEARVSSDTHHPQGPSQGLPSQLRLGLGEHLRARSSLRMWDPGVAGSPVRQARQEGHLHGRAALAPISREKPYAAGWARFGGLCPVHCAGVGCADPRQRIPCPVCASGTHRPHSAAGRGVSLLTKVPGLFPGQCRGQRPSTSLTRLTKTPGCGGPCVWRSLALGSRPRPWACLH